MQNKRVGTNTEAEAALLNVSVAASARFDVNAFSLRTLNYSIKRISPMLT